MASQNRKPRQPRRKGRPPLPKDQKKARMKVGDRRPAVLRLRLEGHSPEVIAHKLGIRPSVVLKDLNVLLGASAAESAQKDEMRALQRMQLDYLWEMLNKSVSAGDTKGIAVALKVLERQAKLFGLDADPRATVTVHQGNADWDAILGAATPGVALGFEDDITN